MDGRDWTRICRPFELFAKGDGFCLAEAEVNVEGEYRFLRLGTSSRLDAYVTAWEVFGTIHQVEGRLDSEDSSLEDDSGDDLIVSEIGRGYWVEEEDLELM
jgi:hypothetical protein